MENNELIESFRNPQGKIDFDEFESRYSQTLGIDSYQKMFGVISALIEGMKQARTPVSFEKIIQVAAYLKDKAQNIPLDKASWETLLGYVYMIHDAVKVREPNEKAEVREALTSLEKAIGHRIVTIGSGVLTSKKPGSDTSIQ